NENVRRDRVLGSNKLNRKKNKSPSSAGQRKEKLSATCSNTKKGLRIVMESFYSLLFVMGVNSVMELENNYLDIVGKLPVEIGIMILRQLDARSLISAAMVNRRWLALCRSDLVLREKVRAELRRQRTARIFPTPVRVLRSSDNCQPFGSVNVQRTIQIVLEPGKF
ncbi:hypothetical protein C0J52_17336, partial [Blattella germanica]